MNYFQRLLLIALLLSGPSLLYHSCATAGEGGSSHYNPGTLGDFAMALIGPAGWYVRNDLWYMDGEMGAVTRGNFTLQDVSQKAWINTIKTIYLTESGVWGGRFGNVLSVPILLDVDVDSTLVGTGLGTAATFTTEVASTNLSFIAKYLANIDNTNRLSNDYLTFSIALPL